MAGRPLIYTELLFAVGFFREIIAEMEKDDGEDGKPNRRSQRITSRGIVVTILDPLLKQRTWHDIHDAFDTLLLCCYQNKINVELTGTFFDIETQKRFASVVIAEMNVPPVDVEVAES